jgi:hypothetical protein
MEVIKKTGKKTIKIEGLYKSICIEFGRYFDDIF